MIDRATEARMRAMEAEIGRLRNGLYQRPIMVPAGGGAAPVKRLEIIDGQTVFDDGLGTVYYGIAYSASDITTVPSAYDPDGVADTPGLFTAIDGIGRANLYIDSVLQSGNVLVYNAGASPVGSLILVTGDKPIAGPLVSILVGAGPTTVSAYRLA